MSEYPEADKLHAVKDQSQAQGELLEWLREQGILLVTWQEWEESNGEKECRYCTHFTNASYKHCECLTCKGTHTYNDSVKREGYVPIRKTTNEILAEFHDIDMVKLEIERRAMLAAARQAHAKEKDSE